MKKSLLNLANYIFKILIVFILLSFTETGKKFINNVVYNLYKTTNYILPAKNKINPEYIISAKYIVYIICITYCLIFFLCVFIRYLCNNIKKDSKNKQERYFNTLEAYINNKYISYVFIDGSWGIGKTHYVLDELEKMNKEYYYVSLFGLNSRELIIKELINEVKSKSLFKAIFDIPILGTIINAIYSMDGLNILKTRNTKIIVFDDLERVAGVVNKRKYEAKFEEYNDIIGFIEYFSQKFKDFTCIVIIDSEKMREFNELLIKPKLKPHTLNLPYEKSKIREISKNYLTDLGEDIIDIYTEIWDARRSINGDKMWTYRPVVRELEILSSVKDEKTIINIALSGFVSLLDLQSVSVGSSIEGYINQIKNELNILDPTNSQLKVIYNLENIKGIEKFLNDAKFQAKDSVIN